MKILQPEASYIISSNTLILQTVRKESSLRTLVIERDRKFIHPRKAIHLIRASCRYFGTSLELATSSAKSVLNNRQKVPVIVAFDHNIPVIMIPTLSTSSEQNIWIGLHAIKSFTCNHKGHTVIELTNHLKVKLELSETTIQRQITLGYLLLRDYQEKNIRFNETWSRTPSN